MSSVIAAAIRSERARISSSLGCNPSNPLPTVLAARNATSVGWRCKFFERRRSKSTRRSTPNPLTTRTMSAMASEERNAIRYAVMISRNQRMTKNRRFLVPVFQQLRARFQFSRPKFSNLKFSTLFVWYRSLFRHSWRLPSPRLHRRIPCGRQLRCSRSCESPTL